MPRAKSTFFRIAATKPTTNSGSDVPKATRETPIIDSGISNFVAIFIADLIKKFAPTIRNEIPTSIKITVIIILCVLCSL